jgi:hypothetical protein
MTDPTRMAYSLASVLALLGFASPAQADCPPSTQNSKIETIQTGCAPVDSSATNRKSRTPVRRDADGNNDTNGTSDGDDTTESDQDDLLWHGNGSLLSHHGHDLPARAGVDWPYGITKDVIQFRTSSKRALGLFQWQISATCTRLKLTANGNDTPVQVSIGRWNDRSKDVQFNTALPLILGTENTGLATEEGDWYVVLVRFDTPPTTDFKLQAECTDEPASDVTPTETPWDGVIEGGYRWSGAASVIAHMFKKQSFSTRDWPFGATKDTTMVSPDDEHEPGLPPVVFFQWQSDPANCASITIEAPSLDQPAVDVLLKNWNGRHLEGSESADVQNLSGTLPMTVTPVESDAGTWNLIRVRFQEDVDARSKVTATCDDGTELTFTHPTGWPFWPDHHDDSSDDEWPFWTNHHDGSSDNEWPFSWTHHQNGSSDGSTENDNDGPDHDNDDNDDDGEHHGPHHGQ